MATIAFTCGAEHTSEFVTSHWFSNTPNSGAVTVSTTHVDGSPNAIKITADAYLRKIANTGRYFACRMRIWVPSGTANATRFLEVDDGGTRLLQYASATTKLLWYDGTASTLAVPLDQWVTVDLEIDSSANPHTTQWKINGVSQTSTSAAAAANNVVQYYLGSGSGSSDRWVDNFAVSLTAGDYPIPAGKSLWNGSAEVWADPIDVAPTAGALVLTGSTPDIALPIAVAPTAGALVLTGATPTVSTPVHVSPTAGSLVLTGIVPSVTVSNAIHVTPGAAHLVLTGAVPVVTVSSPVQPHRGGRRFVGPVNQLPDLPPIRLPQPKYVRPRPAHLGLVGAVPAVTIIDDAELMAILSMIV